MKSSKPMCKDRTKFGIFCSLCPDENECKTMYSKKSEKMFLTSSQKMDKPLYVMAAKG